MRYQYLEQEISLAPADLGTSKDWVEFMIGGRVSFQVNDKRAPCDAPALARERATSQRRAQRDAQRPPAHEPCQIARCTRGRLDPLYYTM
jgi:hypothetical protein